MQPSRVTETGKELDRIVFFSDAVFAIAITLLALEIRLPDVDTRQLPHMLAGLLRTIAVYALSFVVIGLYWVGHHRMFQWIVRYDYTLMWLNLLLLLCVAFLPVANAVLARHYTHPFAVLFYGIALCGTSLASLMLWWYASRKHRLIPANVGKHVSRTMFVRNIATIVVALLAIGIAFLNTTAAFVLLNVYALAAIVSGQWVTLFPNKRRLRSHHR